MTANLRGRLLVVDWDYFFPNPMITEAFSSEVMLYDWKTLENEFYAGPVWSHRTTAFWKNGLELPRTLPHAGFWDRFNFEESAQVAYIGDSNMHAGNIVPSSFDDLEGDGWEEVWLFDAHHDSGYQRTRTLDEFVERGTMSCEDWMLSHAAEGSKLRVRYPAWRASADGSLYECEPPPAVEVDRAVDPGGPVDGWFDGVYICRSGTWVPPWCDDAFEDFVEGPGSVLNTWWIDHDFPRKREWDEKVEREKFEMMQKFLQENPEVFAMNKKEGA